MEVAERLARKEDEKSGEYFTPRHFRWDEGAGTWALQRRAGTWGV